MDWGVHQVCNTWSVVQFQIVKNFFGLYFLRANERICAGVFYSENSDSSMSFLDSCYCALYLFI